MRKNWSLIFLTIVTATTLMACGGDSSPTSPTPTPLSAEVTDFDAIWTVQNDSFWVSTWRVVVTTNRACTCDVRFHYYDANEFDLIPVQGKGDALLNQGQTTVTDVISIPTQLASQVQFIGAEVNNCR